MPTPTKGKLPKAYLRLDPNLDQAHPDPGAMVRLICAANRQPHRGRFKSRDLLDAVLGKAVARSCIDRRDVVEQHDGRYYVPGWDEWQEGDWTVAERQQRIRDRRNAGNVTESRSERDGTVTASPHPALSTPKAARQQGSKAADALTGATVRAPGESEEPYRTAEELTGFPVQRFEPNAIRTLDALSDRRGIPAVVTALRESAPGIETQPPGPWQLIAAARNLLEPFAPSGKPKAGKGFNPTSEEAWDAFGGKP